MADENYNLRLLIFLKEKRGMKYEFDDLQNQTGVSLVELLAVISIIALICVIAIMHMGTSKQQLSRQNVAQDLKVAFERARFDSVKRRALTTGEQAKVIIDTNSFTLVTDANQNGVMTDAVDSRVTNFAGQGISIASGLTLPATVYFNKRGEVTDSAGVPISPSFLVCNPSCTISGGNSNANASNGSLVLVTPTGTVNLLPGGSAIPSFAAPSPITNVSTTSQIKNDVIINGN
jgi:Tfp pilus assembly protein FimT